VFLVTCWSPSLEECTRATKKAATWKRVTAIISKDPARSPSLAPSSPKRPPVIGSSSSEIPIADTPGVTVVAKAPA